MQRLGFAAGQTLVLAASTMTTLALAPKTVILVRHGAVNREAAALTPDGLYGGDVDVPLSERGEAEARAAAQFVADNFGSKVTSVFASPMKRAMYGAERTVEALGKSMDCLLYTSPSPRDGLLSRMPSSA